MSNFFINSFAFGGGAPAAFTTIDLSASPTQADLDIDVSDCDELQIWLIEADSNSSTVPVITMSNDGGSTFKTTANDYTWANAIFSTSITGVALPFMGNSGINLVNHYGHWRILGFNSASFGAMMSGAFVADAGANERSGTMSGFTTFQSVDTVRLGTLADWGTSGQIVYKKISWSNIAAHTNYDYSAATSSASYIDADGFDETWTRFQAITGTTRWMQRVSLDNGSTAYTTANYATFVQDTAFSSSKFAYAYFSLDDSSSKHGLHHTLGLQDGGWAAFRSQGHNIYSGLSVRGHLEQTTAITDIVFSEFDDGTNYSGGTVDGLKVLWNTRTGGTGTISAAGTTFNIDVDGYDNAHISLQYTFALSAADQIDIEISTDNGSTWKNSGYAIGNDTDTIAVAQSAIRTENLATTVNALEVTFHGLAAGDYFVAYGLSGQVSGNPGDFFGMYTGGTEAVTNIRLSLSTANWNAGATYSWRAWT